MKSERRHELQTNYLADHLGTAVEGSRPYAGYVIIGALTILAAALGYGIYSSFAARASAAAWGQYYFNIGSGDAEVFQTVAQDHPGTAAADWSKLAWADNQALQGFEQLYNNRKSAEETIKGAIDAYEEVLSATYEPELKARAAVALGQAYEALGKLEDASRYYKQASSSNQPGLAAMAGNRLAWISSGDGKSFYDWFATVKNTPAIPPALPSDLSKPPITPDITFPDKPVTLPSAAPTAPDATLPANVPLPEAPAATTPPAESTPPVPAPETPAATPPAATATPPAEPALRQPPRQPMLRLRRLPPNSPNKQLLYA